MSRTSYTVNAYRMREANGKAALAELNSRGSTTGTGFQMADLEKS